MNERIEIAEKWYKRLGFPAEMDEEFYALCERCDIPEGLTIDDVQITGEQGEELGLQTLYFVEAMHDEYVKRGIDEELFKEMVKTVRGRLIGAYNRTGTFAIGDLTWQKLLLKGRMFKIGILQFDLKPSPADVPSKGVKKGDNIVGIHVPGGQPLIYERCVQSIKDAKAFVAKHFPDFDYGYMTIMTWLLNPHMADLLGPNSNILKFATLFEVVSIHESDNIIRFVFGNGAKRTDLPNIEPNGRFQTELKREALAGRVFYDCRGMIDINDY